MKFSKVFCWLALGGLLVWVDNLAEKWADSFRHTHNASLVAKILADPAQSAERLWNSYKLTVEADVIHISDDHWNIYLVNRNGEVSIPTELYTSRSDLLGADGLIERAAWDQ